jgi:hypothetical protein
LFWTPNSCLPELPSLTVCTARRSNQLITTWNILTYVVGWWRSRTHCGKSAKYLTAEYHCGCLQSTPLGKLCTEASARSTLQNILELVLWNGLESCRCITPDVISVIKMSSIQYFLYLREQKRVNGGLDPVNRHGVPTQLFVSIVKNSLTDSAVREGALSWCKIHGLLAKSLGCFHLTFSGSLSSTSEQKKLGWLFVQLVRIHNEQCL